MYRITASFLLIRIQLMFSSIIIIMTTTSSSSNIVKRHLNTARRCSTRCTNNNNNRVMAYSTITANVLQRSQRRQSTRIQQQQQQQQQQQERDMDDTSTLVEAIPSSLELSLADPNSKKYFPNIKNESLPPLPLPPPPPPPPEPIAVSSFSSSSSSSSLQNIGAVPKATRSIISTTATHIQCDTNIIVQRSLSQQQQLLQKWIHHTDISFHYFSNSDEILQIQNALLSWYYQHRRKLPWRGDPPPWNGSTAATAAIAATMTKPSTKQRNKVASSSSSSSSSSDVANVPKNREYMQQTYPITTYGVWVSEIMLQQTRVEAVIEKWCLFMYTYPTVSALAQANPNDLNAIWAGLGYYRRLKLLQTAAQIVVDKYDGVIPQTISELLSLPGIGRYTAHAIASISFQQKNIPVVDGNVCRVLSRLRCIGQTIKSNTFKDQYGWTLAQQLVTVQENHDSSRSIQYNYNPGDLNQALMELGATYCSPSGSGIHPNDPLKDHYWSTKLGVALAEAEFDTNGATLDSYLHTAPSSHCPLCATTGITDIVTQFRTKLLSEKEITNMNGEINHDLVRQLGHSMFPLPPPKVHKREELLVVIVIHRYNTSTSEPEWLLMKRPEDNGLLSGQWEFPSFCVWQSDDPVDITATKNTSSKDAKGIRCKTPRADMSNQVPKLSQPQRRKHATQLLDRLLLSSSDGPTKTNVPFQSVNNEPIHHIFSHVRHSMYIEYYNCLAGMDKKIVVPSNNKAIIVQWMNQSDMDQVGITSGVKKIFTAVMKYQKTSGESNKNSKSMLVNDVSSKISKRIKRSS